LVTLVALADSGHGQQLFLLAKKVRGGDKIGHFTLFGTLSFLVNLVLSASELRFRSITLLKGSAIVASVVTAEEFSQLFFQSRSFDLRDLAADLLGIWLCGWLARKYLAWRQSGVKPTGKIL